MKVQLSDLNAYIYAWQYGDAICMLVLYATNGSLGEKGIEINKATVGV